MAGDGRDAIDAVTRQNLLRAMDALGDNADAVEEAMARQIHPLVGQDLTVAFYDLTTVRIHAEGRVQMTSAPMA